MFKAEELPDKTWRTLSGDINLRSVNELDTLLHIACANGKSATANSLILWRADVNAVNMTGRTALHLAAVQNLTDTALMLLHYNADPNVCDYTQVYALT